MSDKRIYIVEDEGIEALSIQRKLERLGYRVLIATPFGEEAVKLAAVDKPDILLMDIHLAGQIDGIEAARQIRLQIDIPVVYLTANSDEKTLQRAMITEPFGYLMKPFDAHDLHTAIETALYKHQTEKKLKQKEQWLEEALAQEKELGELKSRFVSMASHEFRAPLSSILAASSTLRQYGRQMTRPETLKRLYKIETAVNQMNSLLEEVLMIGQAQANKLSLSPEPVQLVSFCDEIVQELQVAEGVNHKLVFKVVGHERRFCGDPKYLRQLVTNLLSNAVKYSPPGGVIAVDLLFEESHVLLKVADFGIGIPPADQPHLFEPFHRAKNVGSISGTGLGLAIVKKAVDLHGGTIDYESSVGHGTQFTVMLPYQPN